MEAWQGWCVDESEVLRCLHVHSQSMCSLNQHPHSPSSPIYSQCLTGDADAGEDTAELRKQAINQGEWVSFFDWFRSDDATTQEDENNNNNGQTGDIVARVIKEEIWPDPVRYWRTIVHDVCVWWGVRGVMYVCGGVYVV